MSILLNNLKSLILNSLFIPKYGVNINFNNYLEEIFFSSDLKIPEILQYDLKNALKNKSFISSISTGNYNHPTVSAERISWIINAVLYIVYSEQIYEVYQNVKDSYPTLKKVSVIALINKLYDLKDNIDFFSNQAWQSLEKITKSSFNYQNSKEEHNLVVMIVTSLIISCFFIDLTPYEEFNGKKKWIDKRTWLIFKTYKKFTIIKNNFNHLPSIIKFDQKEKSYQSLDELDVFSNNEYAWNTNIILKEINDIILTDKQIDNTKVLAKMR